MNKKNSRKFFLKNNILAGGGFSLGLGVPYSFHTKRFLSKGNIKQDSVLRDVDSMIRCGSWVRKGNNKACDVILALNMACWFKRN